MNLAITGIGMLSPVGLDPLVAFHSVRSGITRLASQPLPDRIREWIVGGRILSRVPFLRERKLQGLAEIALRQAWSSAWGTARPRGRTAALFGVPETIRPGRHFPGPQFKIRPWLIGLGVPADGPVERIEAGASSTQISLERAASLLSSGTIHACLVGAVDSQLQQRITRWHEEHARLKCGYMTDGLMPAEAACFLVVEPEASAAARKAPILACVRASASAKETSTIVSDKPNAANALTKAARTALQEAGTEPIALQAVWCDLNGESYRAREWAFTEIRLRIQTHTQLIHPADCHGDLGSASAVSLLAFAALAQATTWTGGRPVLVFTGSEGGHRAATVITPPGSDSPRASVLPVTISEPRVYPVSIELPPLGPDDVDPAETPDPPRTYFDWQLRQEHLDDLASIYYQREKVLRDPKIPWWRASEHEQRLLNHLDAVVAGGATSIWAVASGVLGDEEGVCFAGALLIGCLPSSQNLALLEEALEDPSLKQVQGLEAGLRHAPASSALEDALRRWLSHPHPLVRALAVGSLGHRRLAGPECVPLLHSDHPVLVRATAEALGRCSVAAAETPLRRLLTSEDTAIRETALLALFLINPVRSEENCRQLCRAGEALGGLASLLLATRGNLSDYPILLRRGQPFELDRVGLEAIGVVGNVHAVPLLLQALLSEREEVPVAASEALELITGAGLRETILFEETLEAFDFKLGPREIERISTSFVAWTDWWARHRPRFDPRQRWRRGQVFDLTQCVAELEGNYRFHERRRAYWELRAGSERAMPFEPDWFVPRQRQAIAAWAARIQNRR